MTDVTIFKQKDAAVNSTARELSSLGKSLAAASTVRRIQTNTNGTFRRLINGEQVGNAVRGEINAIIVAALPKVSRVFYKEAFDPKKEATAPDCWSNFGDKPDDASPLKQHSNCLDCPQNIKGSGANGSKACRYQRRVAMLLDGDDTGDLYQFNIPAKSLFGKGQGNVHPFESYVKYLIANGESPDTVVTNISYDINADSMELLFTPLRRISDEEAERVRLAQDKPEAKMYTMITMAQAKKEPVAKAAEKPAEAKVTRSEEPEEDEAVAEPTKRASKKPVEPPSPKVKQTLADAVAAWDKE